MNTLYFVAMVAGVVWLMIWSVLPDGYRGRGWWPFDMREPTRAARHGDREPAKPEPPVASTARGSWRLRAAAALTGPEAPTAPSRRHAERRMPLRRRARSR